MLHGLESLPADETKVRVRGVACAGTAGRTAASAAARPMLASLVEFMENSSVDGFLLADALPAGQIHGRWPADSANGRRSKDVHCFQIIGPPMGIPAAVRPRDFGTSRSRLCAEPTPSLGVRRRGAGLGCACPDRPVRWPCALLHCPTADTSAGNWRQVTGAVAICGAAGEFDTGGDLVEHDAGYGGLREVDGGCAEDRNACQRLVHSRVSHKHGGRTGCHNALIVVVEVAVGDQSLCGSGSGRPTNVNSDDIIADGAVCYAEHDFPH